MRARIRIPKARSYKRVFARLGGLDVIHDRLEHGAEELLYQEDIGVSPNQIEKWICPKNRLPLFRNEEGPDLRPDYSSKEIVDQARRLMES